MGFIPPPPHPPFPFLPVAFHKSSSSLQPFQGISFTRAGGACLPAQQLDLDLGQVSHRLLGGSRLHGGPLRPVPHLLEALPPGCGFRPGNYPPPVYLPAGFRTVCGPAGHTCTARESDSFEVQEQPALTPKAPIVSLTAAGQATAVGQLLYPKSTHSLAY